MELGKKLICYDFDLRSAKKSKNKVNHISMSISKNMSKALILIFISVIIGMWCSNFSFVPLLLLLVWIFVAISIRPQYGVYLIVLFTPLLSSMPRGLLVPFFRPNELILIGVFVIYVFNIFATKRKVTDFSFVDKAFLIFLIGRTIMPFCIFLLRGQTLQMESFRILFVPIQYYIVLRLVVDSIHSKKEITTVISLLLFASVIVSIIGILQGLRVPGIDEFLQKWYPRPHTFSRTMRVTSVLVAWNTAGYYFAMNAVIALAIYTGKKFRFPLFFLPFAIASNILAMLLTGSFSSIITFLFALCMLAFMSGKIKYYARYLILIIPILGIVIYYFFLPVIMYRLHFQFRSTETIIPTTLVFRLNYWKETILPAILKSPLWGLGPMPGQGRSTEESYYFFLLARGGGLIGIVAFFGFVLVLFKNLKRIFVNSHNLTKLLSLIGIVLILQILVANIAGSYFEYSGVSETFWIILALIIVSLRINKIPSNLWKRP